MEGMFDTDTNTLTWTVTYSGLSSPPIGAHFHGPVSYLGLTPEENAPIQVGTPGNLASPFHGVAKIDDTQAKDLKDGRWYFNLHSKISPPAKFADPSSADEGFRFRFSWSRHGRRWRTASSPMPRMPRRARRSSRPSATSATPPCRTPAGSGLKTCRNFLRTRAASSRRRR